MTPDRLVGAALSALLVCAPAVAGPAREDAALRALQWLHRMSHAMRHENYIGRFVYQHDDQLDAMEIRHFVTPDGEKSHLIALNGAVTEVLHDGDRVICVTPRADSLAVERFRAPRGLSHLLPSDTGRLARSYEIQRFRDNRIADRAAVVVGLLPRDEYRYGLRLFLDKHTALPLRADRLTRDGRVLSRILFVNLLTGAEVAGFDDALRVSGDRERYQLILHAANAKSNPARAEAAGSQQRWRFGDLPPGFRLVGRRRLPGRHARVEQYIFSDGLSSFSVYLEPSRDGAVDSLVHAGAVHAYGRALGDRHVTIVGEVPGATVERVARGIEPLDGAPPKLAGKAAE